MPTIEVAFKNPSRTPINGVLEISPENSDAIFTEGSDIFINKSIPPITLNFGTAIFDLNAGRYIFSLRDSAGKLISSFSAIVPDVEETVYLSDLIKKVFSGDLSIASNDSLGVIKVGSGLDISPDGTLSVSAVEVNAAIAERIGVQTETRIYVSPKAPPHYDAFDNNGQSPFRPFRSLERALLQAALASEEGVTIELAPGEYWVDNRPGKKVSDITALRNDPVEFAKITQLPASYGRYQDASALVKKNARWIVNEAFAVVQERLTSDAITLTPKQSRLCKRDLALIVRGISEDLSEMSNKHTVCSARSYRNPRMELRYLTVAQVAAFKSGLDSIRLNSIKAVINQAPIKDLTLTVDSTTNNPVNVCANVQATITSLTNLIKTTLDGITNPWQIEITRGVFPKLHWFNPPRVVLDPTQNEFDQEIWGFYRDAATLIKNSRESLIDIAYNSIQASVPSDKRVKCRRDIGFILDAVVDDLRVIGNANTLKVAQLYKDINGNYYTKPDGAFVLLEAERTLMASALQLLRTNIATTILNDFGDPTDYTPSEADPTVVTATAQGLIDIVRNTLTSPGYNPWSDTLVNKGVQVLSGGIVVPNGTTFATIGLRRPVIRPLYIAEEDLEYGTTASIFKLTSEAFSFGFTYKDTPGANSSHHKVYCSVFASDDLELNPANDSYYYGKVGALFFNNTLYFNDFTTGTEIVAPAGEGDRFFVDTTKGASPYIYNCSVRSDWGLNGMWADGDRVTGLKSMVTAQFTVVSLQRDKNAWQKWDATLQTWVDLAALDNFYTMKPALYIDYVHGITDPEKEPEANAIRIRPTWRQTGFTGTNDAFIQIVSCFCIGSAQSYFVDSGADFSITNSNTNFGEIALVAQGFKKQSFGVDSGFDLIGIIPPKPLTKGDIVKYEIGVFDAATTWQYFLDTGNRDRVYVANGFKLPSVFTLKATTKVYLFYSGLDYEADCVPNSNSGVANALDPDNNIFYIQVDPATNAIFPDGADINQVFALQAASISIKRVADQRKTEERVYRFLIEAPDSNKRRPPVGFILNTGVKALTNSNKIYWVYESVTIDGQPNQFAVTCLGLEPDGTANEQSQLIPLKLEDYDEEPEFDPTTLEILFPDYNPDRSITKRIAREFFDTADLGYIPVSPDWINPSNAVSNVNNIGTTSTGQPATIQWHRPSQIRCSGHTFEYAGFPQYSQGLPQFQQIIIPTEAKLSKNRKNFLGGIVYYDGLDDEGNVWTGNTRLNLASGAEESINIVQTPTPPLPADFDTLNVATRIIVAESLEINGNSVVIPTNGFLSIGGTRMFFAGSTPSSGFYLVGDIVVNRTPSEGEPYGWRLLSNSPGLVWEPIDGYIQKQKILTELLSVPAGSEFNVVGNFNVNPQNPGNLNNVNIGATFRGTGAFTNLSATGQVTLTPSGANSITINPNATGSIDNVNIGSNNRGTGSFSTLNANGTTIINPVNGNVTIAPSGSGTLTISSGNLGSINNTSVGLLNPAAGNFTSLVASGAVTLSPSTGTVTINPSSVGSINNMNIGASTRGTGAFTSLSANGTVTINPSSNNVTIAPSGSGVLSLSSGNTGNLNNVTIGGTTPAAGTFTSLTSTGATNANNLVVSNNAQIGGNLVITGSLTVNGGQNEVNTITSTTVDPVLDIGGASVGSLTNNDGNDRGILTTYYDTQQRKGFFGFINPSAEFIYYRQVSLTSENKVNTAASTLGNAVFANVTSGLTVPSGFAFSVSGTFSVSPSGLGNLNNVTIGGTTPAAGTFTSLTVNNSASISPSGTVTISPTGALTINPSAASAINNTSIGATTAATGRFTTLTATGAVNLSPSGASITISPSGTGGTVTINPSAAGAINNMSIGAATPSTGAFTSVTVGGVALLQSGTINSVLLPVGTSAARGVLQVGSGLSVSSGTVSARDNVLQMRSFTVNNQPVGIGQTVTLNIFTNLPVGSFIKDIEVVVPSNSSTTALLAIGHPGDTSRYVAIDDIPLGIANNYPIYPTSKITTSQTVSITLTNSSVSSATTCSFVVYFTYSTLAQFLAS